VYNEVVSKVIRVNTPAYNRALYLYKEHMLTTAFDKYDKELFHYGTGLLQVSDKKRGNCHKNIIKDVINFLGLIELDPSLGYVNGVTDEQND
jgi:hypothetical protein